MSKLNLTPETLRQLYPPMPEETKLKLQHRMRQLMLEAPKTKPVRRISRGLAIAIAITALLLGTALAEVTTGVVSRTIQQVVRLVTGQPEQEAVKVPAGALNQEPLASLDLLGANVKVWTAQADSRRVYVEAVTRSLPDSPVFFGNYKGRYSPSDDLFPPQEKAGPMGGYENYELPFRAVVLQLEQTGKSGGILPRFSMNSNRDIWAWPLLRADIDQGPMSVGDSELYFTQGNSDGSQYSSASMLHGLAGGKAMINLAVTIGAIDEGAEMDSFAFSQSERSILKLDIPIHPDTHPQLLIPIEKKFPDVGVTVDSITFTFTPLATYYDVKWHWTNNRPSPYHDYLAFGLTDDRGKELKNRMPIFNKALLEEGATSFEGSLPAGDPPATLQLHWLQDPNWFMPCPQPISFNWKR